MPKIPYNKPHLSYSQQRQKLIQQGMSLDLPDDQVEYYLSHLNYYRLSGYWYEYRLPSNQFKPNTNFSEIIQLYKFDKSLRILLLDAIEQIEVSIRTKLAYHLGQSYGAHPLLNTSLLLIRENIHRHFQNCKPRYQEVEKTLLFICSTNTKSHCLQYGQWLK